MKAKTLRFLYKGLYSLTIFSFLASAVLTVNVSPTSASPEPDKVGVCHANGNDTHIYLEVPPNEGGYPQGHFTEGGNPENGHEQDYLANSREDCGSATSTPTSSSRTVNTATPTPTGSLTAISTKTPTNISTSTKTPTRTPTNTTTPTKTPTPTNTPTPSYAFSIIYPGTSPCSFFTFTISNISEDGEVITKVSWLVQPDNCGVTQDQLAGQDNQAPQVNSIPVTGVLIPVTGLGDNTFYIGTQLANLGFGALAMAVIVHGFALGKREDED